MITESETIQLLAEINKDTCFTLAKMFDERKSLKAYILELEKKIESYSDIDKELESRMTIILEKQAEINKLYDKIENLDNHNKEMQIELKSECFMSARKDEQIMDLKKSLQLDTTA